MGILYTEQRLKDKRKMSSGERACAKERERVNFHKKKKKKKIKKIGQKQSYSQVNDKE